ncbi:hypothetical protein FACS1894180_8690 [Bacteroidia bacterium]|nr:hypothetical protein FACS1894180_8690 [Bacteroidia bacterium]
MDYVNTHLTAETLEKYYQHFIAINPEKTLKMWRNAVDFYAEKNVGDRSYEDICCWLKLMRKLNGGDIVVQQMIDNSPFASSL